MKWLLSEQEFIIWCKKYNVSEKAKVMIEKIRSSDPVRSVSSGGRNVPGNYPSKRWESVFNLRVIL